MLKTCFIYSGVFVVIASILSVYYNQLRKIEYRDFQLQSLEQDQALCMDGSQYKYYYAEGDSEKFIIMFEGVELCDKKFTECFEMYGSSQNYTNYTRFKGGILDKNIFNNQAFFNFSFVFLKSCTGFAFVSDRDDPVEIDGETLYLKGNKVATLALQEVYNRYKLSRAKIVVLAGYFTGGVAALTYSNYLYDM